MRKLGNNDLILKYHKFRKFKQNRKLVVPSKYSSIFMTTHIPVFWNTSNYCPDISDEEREDYIHRVTVRDIVNDNYEKARSNNKSNIIFYFIMILIISNMLLVNYIADVFDNNFQDPIIYAIIFGYSAFALPFTLATLLIRLLGQRALKSIIDSNTSLCCSDN